MAPADDDRAVRILLGRERRRGERRRGENIEALEQRLNLAEAGASRLIGLLQVGGDRFEVFETDIGRHLEYSVPVFGVNLGRPADSGVDSSFAPAGDFATVCVPPPVSDMDMLWGWFRTKPGGIDSTEGFVFTLGRNEEILVVDVDIDAVRSFPGYFSTRQPERSAKACVG